MELHERTAAVSETSRSVHKGYGYVGYPSAWRPAETLRLDEADCLSQAATTEQ